MDRKEEILKLMQTMGIVRTTDVEALGIPREYLQRLYKQGKIERIGRGLYTLPTALPDKHASLSEVAKRVPKGIVCLVSALYFHNLTTQLPFEIWLAIEGTSWKPQITYPPLNVVRFTGEAFHYGVESHHINNVPVKIYTIAKTVADCFKFRHKVGLDVALEALRETFRDKRANIDDIWQAAKICRVSNVMKPYLEAIL